MEIIWWGLPRFVTSLIDNLSPRYFDVLADMCLIGDLITNSRRTFFETFSRSSLSAENDRFDHYDIGNMRLGDLEKVRRKGGRSSTNEIL